MFNSILSSCNFVVDNCKYLKINYEKLDDFIKNIDCRNLKNWLASNPYGLIDLDIELLINFLLIYESILYSFWGDNKWHIDTPEGVKDGSDGLLYAMLKYVKETKNTDFSEISYEKFSDILKGNVDIPLLKDRYNTVVSVSKIVNSKMMGNFYNYIKDVTLDIDLFNIITENFPSFTDERQYNGKTIYFYKLAQLLTSDILHVREIVEGVEVDYSNLFGCADYKIPQTLRALGIVEYSNELAEIVDNKKEIIKNSCYEIEIRASQLVVIDYIKKKLGNAKAIDINDFFFVYSAKVKGFAKPYHLCRNTNY